MFRSSCLINSGDCHFGDAFDCNLSVNVLILSVLEVPGVKNCSQIPAHAMTCETKASTRNQKSNMAGCRGRQGLGIPEFIIRRLGSKRVSLCGSSVTVSELGNRCGLATMGVRPSVLRIEIAVEWASVRFVAMVDRCVTID